MATRMSRAAPSHHGLEGDREVLQKFEVQKFLGKGSYGSVFRVKRISDGKIYALKETNVRHMSAAERHEAVNEIRVLASVKNQHIVSYHEAFIDGNRLCIVMEYAQQGDLSKMIRKRHKENRPMDEDLIWSYFIQLVRGLASLHANRVLHRDMKAANVLRVSPTMIKIGDLGVAKVMKHAMTNTQIGTPHYMPPEVWKNRPYGFTSDTWALGCLLYEMCCFTVPFEARSMSELRYKVLRGKYSPIPQFYSHDMSQMIRLLLDQEPNNRPSMSQLLEHPSVRKRNHVLSEHAPSPPASTVSTMLETIKVPKNLRLLKGRLPAPSYPETLHEDVTASWPPPPPPPQGSEARLPHIGKDTNKSSPPVVGGEAGTPRGQGVSAPRGVAPAAPAAAGARGAGVRASEPAVQLPRIGGRGAPTESNRQSYAMGSRAPSDAPRAGGGGGRYARAPPAIQQELYDRLQKQLPGSRDPHAPPSYGGGRYAGGSRQSQQSGQSSAAAGTPAQGYAGGAYNYPRYQRYQEMMAGRGGAPSAYAHQRLGSLLEHPTPQPPSYMQKEKKSPYDAAPKVRRNVGHDGGGALPELYAVAQGGPRHKRVAMAPPPGQRGGGQYTPSSISHRYY